ncbi:MAG: hypothetical protein H0U13_15730 [Gemmatimonadaceae bacterium]|nr:hypothetical protein [Gemmatimonadaceae bacterium]
MKAERVETIAEQELARYWAQIRAMTSDEVDLLSVEEGIVMRLRAIGAEMLREVMKWGCFASAHGYLYGRIFSEGKYCLRAMKCHKLK